MSRTKASLLVIMTTLMTVVVLFLMPYTPKIAVRTVKIEQGDLIRSILLAGTVGYAQEQPCISLRGGKIAQVHVKPGQQVKNGELLFTLDTSAEEKALAAIAQVRYERQRAAQVMDATVAALAMGDEFELLEKEEELRAAIAAAQIRSQLDGIVEVVYVDEGMYTDAAALLGHVRGDEKCVVAAVTSAELRGASIGAAASLTSSTGTGLAMLKSISAPTADASAWHRLTLSPVEQETLQENKVGEKITVELIEETLQDVALIPVSAVGEKNEVWVVEDGKAQPVAIDVNNRSDSFVAASAEEWVGKSIVLLPDESELKPGCLVKEVEAK